MDYQKHYDLLIKNSRENPYIGYTESHHILPKCLGGSNDPENLVEVSARVHFVLHRILVKLHPKNRGLVYALWRMMLVFRKNKRLKISSRTYQQLRKSLISVPISEETREKMRKAKLGVKQSEKVVANRVSKTKGQKRSQDIRSKMSESQKKLGLSPEAKAKRSEILKNRWKDPKIRESIQFAMRKAKAQDDGRIDDQN